MGSFGLGVPLLHSRAQVFMHLGLKHFQRILCGSWVPWAPGLTDLPDSALMVVLEAWLRSNCYLLMVVLEAWLRSNCYLLLSAVWANVLAFLISSHLSKITSLKPLCRVFSALSLGWAGVHGVFSQSGVGKQVLEGWHE